MSKREGLNEGGGLRTKRTATVTVKGNGAVHEDSGLGDVAHVLTEGGMTYDVTCTMVDLARQLNSYYTIQARRNNTAPSE